MFSALVAAAAVACAVSVSGVGGQTIAEQLFQADVEIYNDPTILGSVTGKMYYNYQSGNGKQRIDYDVGNPPAYTKVMEVIDYQNDLRSLFCTACEASTYRKTMPVYFLTSSDTANPSTLGLPDTVTVGSRSCTGKVRSGVSGEGNVIVVYRDSSNRVCRAIFDDDGVAGTRNIGRYVDFVTAPALIASNSPAFAIDGTWNCPAPICAVKIDLSVVLDESGSVSRTSFTQEKSFVIDIFNSYTIAPDVVQGGAVAFASRGRTVSSLTGSRSRLLSALNNLRQAGGGTCIPCGIEIAHAQVVGSSRNVGRVVITLTDGGNNVRNSELQGKINAMQSAGIISFGIGVGSGFVRSQVLALAYNIQSRFFDVSSGFGGLTAILGQLITETCQDLPGNPCGAGCRGFCACGQTCLCPTSCKSTNICLNGTCVAGANGNGCRFVANPCDDNDGCTVDTCDAVAGCQHTPRNCAGTDPCRIYSCDSTLSTGCVNTPNTCQDANPCTSDVCTPGVGCQYGAVPCDMCSPPAFNTNCSLLSTTCVTYACINNNASCTGIPRDCDDNNACSVDTCDPVLGCVNSDRVCDDGNACTLDPCDALLGCQVGGPVDCDDNNVCTIDTCDNATGCVHTPINCDDGDICTLDTCNSITGCVSRERDCSIEPEIARFVNECQLALCSVNVSTGCYLELLDGSTIDECGVCNGDGTSCQQLETTEIAAISTVALVFIILAAVAFCAAVAFIGGKKGYDIYTRNQGGMFGADTSPMYNSGNLAGESALYEGGGD